MNTEQSKIVSRVIELHRQNREPVINLFCGHEFTTLPDVYSPFIAPSGKLTFFFAAQPDFKGKRVLDVGCGSGIVACMAALSGAEVVVGIDINPVAVDNARLNAQQLQVKGKTDFRVGDTFGPLEHGEEFDIIFANLPFALGTPRDQLEAAFFDPELGSLRHYIEELPQWQTKECRAYICVSDLDDADLQNIAQSRGLVWNPYVTVHAGCINLSIVELSCRTPAVR